MGRRVWVMLLGRAASAGRGRYRWLMTRGSPDLGPWPPLDRWHTMGPTTGGLRCRHQNRSTPVARLSQRPSSTRGHLRQRQLHPRLHHRSGQLRAGGVRLRSSQGSWVWSVRCYRRSTDRRSATSIRLRSVSECLSDSSVVSWVSRSGCCAHRDRRGRPLRRASRSRPSSLVPWRSC